MLNANSPHARAAAAEAAAQGLAAGGAAADGGPAGVVLDLEPGLDQQLEEAVRRSAEKGTWKVRALPRQQHSMRGGGELQSRGLAGARQMRPIQCDGVHVSSLWCIIVTSFQSRLAGCPGQPQVPGSGRG